MAEFITITADDLQELIEYGVGDLYTDTEGRNWRIMVTDKLHDTTRWGIVTQFVFQNRDTDKFYEFLYETPAGDSNMDFWGDFGTSGRIREVHEKRVSVITYG